MTRNLLPCLLLAACSLADAQTCPVPDVSYSLEARPGVLTDTGEDCGPVNHDLLGSHMLRIQGSAYSLNGLALDRGLSTDGMLTLFSPNMDLTLDLSHPETVSGWLTAVVSWAGPRGRRTCVTEVELSGHRN